MAATTCSWCLGAGQVLQPALDEWGEQLWNELVPVVCPGCGGPFKAPDLTTP